LRKPVGHFLTPVSSTALSLADFGSDATRFKNIGALATMFPL